MTTAVSTEENYPLTHLEKIERKVDTQAVAKMAVSDASGGLAFQNMVEVMEFAKLMALSDVAVRKHLRGNPGACLGVTMQAFEWRMSPFAVANKSYSVSDQIAYEAQLIQAVIQMRAPIKGRIKSEYLGEGQRRKLRIWAVTTDNETVEYTSPELSAITPKNSPLWKNDPDQQLHYFSVRSWCRRHFPEVLLGVYSKDELEDGQGARDVTPAGEATEVTKPTAIEAPRVRAADRLKPKAGSSLPSKANSDQQTSVLMNEVEPEHDADTGEVHDGGEPDIDDSLAANDGPRRDDEF